MKNPIRKRAFPKTKVSDYKWSKNGDFINCPGGFVIGEMSPAEINSGMSRAIYNKSAPCVLMNGKIIQICESKASAKRWVVAHLRCMANEYVGLPWGK